MMGLFWRRRVQLLLLLMVIMNCVCVIPLLIGFYSPTSTCGHYYSADRQLHPGRRLDPELANQTAVHAAPKSNGSRAMDFTRHRIHGRAEPSRVYEDARRTIDNGVAELWYSLRSQITELKKHADENPNKTIAKNQKGSLDRMLEEVGDQIRSVMVDIEKLKRADGYDWWRQRVATNLSGLVQKRLVYVQNPADCRSAKKVVCTITECGFGCQVHHLAYCLIVAYATQRTLVLESKGWSYCKEGWEKFFLPLSETCTTVKGPGTLLQSLVAEGSDWWNLTTDHKRLKGLDDQVIRLPTIDKIRGRARPKFLPLSIPADLAPLLTRLHGDPFVWWIGQILTYLLRPQPWLRDEIEKEKTRLKFENPIVGVQVRRTDKLKNREASFHGIEEYMVHVEEFYKRMEVDRPNDTIARRVYLATDEPKLILEAINKYPEYKFISDNKTTLDAGPKTRYSEKSLRGIIRDVHLLSQSDFIVCTLSSNVCRLAYALMQHSHPDAAASFRSLDDIYWFIGQHNREQTAVYAHRKRAGDTEIELARGDRVHVGGNHWDGYSKGVNARTGLTGLYPSYKAKYEIRTAKMPTYDGIGN